MHLIGMSFESLYSSLSVDSGYSETTPEVIFTVPSKRAQLGGLATRALSAVIDPPVGPAKFVYHVHLCRDVFSCLESIETFTGFMDLRDARVAEAKIKNGGPKNKILYRMALTRAEPPIGVGSDRIAN